jgi:hypothetical protein
MEQAVQRMAEAERQEKALEAKLAAAKKNADEWRLVVAKMKTLTHDLPNEKVATTGQDAVATAAPGRVSVKAPTWAGRCAKLILENGAMSLGALVHELAVQGHGTEGKEFASSVNSALWRRKEDMFTKDEEGRYILRTREIDFLN